tara:strand:+ start:312 stop:1268 length:957 start_codon:yes stop_codon:yes gene_type:complete
MPTPNTRDAMRRFRAGKAGFTDKAHLKAKGLIPRADGTKRKSDKYKEELDKGDTAQVKTVIKGLKKASGLHAKQAKSLEKQIDDDMDRQPQDKDVKKVKGTQPKKYYKTLDKKTKKKRADFFKTRKPYRKSDDDDDYKPAPGDAKAKTKPSTFTKKFKKMYGEDAPANATGTAVAGTGDDSSTVVIKKKKDKETMRDRLLRRFKIKETIDRTIPDLEIPKDEIKEKAKMMKAMAMKSEVSLDETIKAVQNKAKKTGMPYSILKQVYNRGMAAWKGGHRPGATQQQWALARVNSFVTKSSGTWGGADKDLAKKVRAAKK